MVPDGVFRQRNLDLVIFAVHKSYFSVKFSVVTNPVFTVALVLTLAKPGAAAVTE